ncbi:hypothetical protein Tco_0976433 [Tanacetum coccineum]|uniref:Uncharacterized protein n=1 Tax=Tanacetum coccineum TaxID=301880 RepID=A0ABQ5EHD1_9ASTR
MICHIRYIRYYRTQPSRVRKMLTAWKRVRALPLGHLTSRYPLDHSSSDHSSFDNSSSNSLSDSSSSHSLPDSSFSSKDSSFDTLATIYVRPSRKRHRFPAASVPLATPTPGALSPVRADLLPPRKRIRGYVDIDADTVAAETATTLEVDIGIEADVGVEVGIGIEREDKVKEEVESRNKGTIKIRVDRVSDIKIAHRDQGHRTLVANKQGAGMLDRIRVLQRDNMRLRGMLYVERERINSLRHHMSYTQEELRQIRMSRYYDRANFKMLETFAMRRLGYRPYACFIMIYVSIGSVVASS